MDNRSRKYQGPISNPNKEQIAEWENMYGEKLIVITLDEIRDDEDKIIQKGKTAYLKPPVRPLIKRAMSLQFKANEDAIDMVSPGELILNSCYLGGDPKLKSEDFYFFRLCSAITKEMQEITGFLQKR